MILEWFGAHQQVLNDGKQSLVLNRLRFDALALEVRNVKHTRPRSELEHSGLYCISGVCTLTALVNFRRHHDTA